MRVAREIIGCLCWTVAAVQIVLVVGCAHVQPIQPDDSSDQGLLASLRSEDYGTRRRAALALALSGRESQAVVDAFVKNGLDCGTAIRILGPSTGDQAIKYLASDDYRDEALALLSLFASPPVSDKKPLESLVAKPDTTSAAKYVAKLLLLASTPSTTREDIDKVAAEYSALLPDAEEWGYFCAAFPLTRHLGLEHARKRIGNAIQRLEREGDPGDVGGIFVIAMAARSRALSADDINLLDRFQKALNDNKSIGTSLDPAFAIIRWLGSGRQRDKLDAALTSVGTPTDDLRRQWAIIQGFGDGLLMPEKDIPLLIDRAADTEAPIAVRVGAVRLLGFLGSADKRVHKLFGELLDSPDELLSGEVADAIRWCVDQDGSILRLVDQRLKVEASSSVKAKLVAAKRRICPQ